MLKNCSILTPFCLFLVCFLAACSGKKTAQIERCPTVCEARMSQVPFPCGVAVRELGPAVDGSDYKMWEYETNLSPAALRDFYRTQAELEGWREIANYFTTGDLFFIYQRPKKILTIDGRQQGRQLLVRCFTGSVSKI